MHRWLPENRIAAMILLQEASAVPAWALWDVGVGLVDERVDEPQTRPVHETLNNIPIKATNPVLAGIMPLQHKQVGR